MSRLNPLTLPILGRAARPTPALNVSLRSRLAAPQRSLSSRIYTQAAPHLRAPRRSPHASLRPDGAFAQAARRGFGTSARRAGKEAPREGELSFSARIKKLTKEYGWVTMGVYLALSVLDFPFCFLLVKVAGPDRIGKWTTQWGAMWATRGWLTGVGELEHMVSSNMGKVVPEPVQTAYGSARDMVKGLFPRGEPTEEPAGDWGVRKAQEANRNEASMLKANTLVPERWS